MPKTEQLNIRTTKELLEKIDAKAKEIDRSRNWSIEEAIRQYCKASGR